MAGLDLPPLVGQAVTSLQAPLQEAITGFIRKNVTKIVSSDAFENVWEEANRAAHEQIVATLRGDPDALAQISDTGTLTLDVTPIIEQVKTSLEQAGFTLVSRIPTINVTFPIASSADLVRLQSAYRLIDIVGGLLPYLSLALLAAGVLAAQHRSRALVVAGLSLAGAMLLLGIALTLGRSLYASSLPPTVQRVDTAVSIYDQFVSLLRIELRVGLVLGLLLAIIAFVAGGTTAARQLRASSSHASAWLRTAGDRRGISTGPVGVWLDQQRTLVRVVVISLAALALVLADRLTPAYVVGVFVVALVVLGLVTLAARPRGAAPVEEEERRPRVTAGHRSDVHHAVGGGLLGRQHLRGAFPAEVPVADARGRRDAGRRRAGSDAAPGRPRSGRRPGPRPRTARRGSRRRGSTPGRPWCCGGRSARPG